MDALVEIAHMNKRVVHGNQIAKAFDMPSEAHVERVVNNLQKAVSTKIVSLDRGRFDEKYPVDPKDNEALKKKAKKTKSSVLKAYVENGTDLDLKEMATQELYTRYLASAEHEPTKD